jgi:intracellular multiplication protein IcmG
MMSAQPASPPAIERPVVPVASPPSQAPVSQMPPQVSPVAQQNSGMSQQPVVEMPGQSPPAQPPQPAVSTVQTYNNNAMPAVMPVMPQYNELDASSMGAAQAPSMIIESGSSGYDDKAAALAAENAKLTEQLQAEYNKRISEYQNQNKILQEQVQSLSNKVATVENQMNQMMQALGPQGGNPPQIEALPALPERAAPPPHIPYTVQAIIPGRAWLRSSNGETLTVAEGDEVKGVGRVGKIDPYDGTVEINVQGRSVVLSYGNGN